MKNKIIKIETKIPEKKRNKRSEKALEKITRNLINEGIIRISSNGKIIDIRSEVYSER